MGTQGAKRTDACGVLKRAGPAAKKADQVPHVGSQRHIANDPDGNMLKANTAVARAA